jgi:hypothetical protein
MELEQTYLKAAAAFSTAAYDSGMAVWASLVPLGQSTGSGGWIVNGSAEWTSTYGAPLGGTYQSAGGIQTRACAQLSQTTAAARWIAAMKFRAVLSYRVAIARNCLSLQKKFSIR